MDKPRLKWNSTHNLWFCWYKGKFFFGESPLAAYNKFALAWNTANNWNNSRFPLAV